MKRRADGLHPAGGRGSGEHKNTTHTRSQWQATAGSGCAETGTETGQRAWGRAGRSAGLHACRGPTAASPRLHGNSREWLQVKIYAAPCSHCFIDRREGLRMEAEKRSPAGGRRWEGQGQGCRGLCNRCSYAVARLSMRYN